MPGGGIAGAQVGDLQAGEAMLFDRAHAVFHPAFCLPLADIARGNGQAAVVSQVEGRGIAHRRFASGALEDGGCEVIDHDGVGDATKKLPGVVMAGQNVRHGLGDGACHVQHAAVAPDHAKAAQLPVRLPDRDGATRAPVDLGARARGTGQREKGGVPPGAHRAPIRRDQRVAAVTAGLAQALENLGGRRRLALQQADHLWCERIACAWARPGLAWPEVCLGKPVGHRLESEGQGLRHLRGAQSLVRMEVLDVAEACRIHHARVSTMCLNMSLIAMGVSAVVRRGGPGAGTRGVCSRAQP